MIDHMSLRVQDLSRAVDFYKAALAPLGYQVLMEFPGVAGMGAGGKPDLWIMETDQPINPTHVALNGERVHIRDFHTAALAAGGTDNGPPGPRADYHPHYYAAFILDPEGNNVEVVCHYPDDISDSPSAKKAPKKAAKTATKKPAKNPAKKLAKPAAKVAAKAAAKKPAKKPAKQPAKQPGKQAAKKPAKAAGKKRR